MTLEQIEEKIFKLRQELQTSFTKLNTPDNVFITKDPHWGKRQLTISLRLDEFSVNRLKEEIPRIENIMNQYIKLRKAEKEILEKVLIERATRPSISNL